MAKGAQGIKTLVNTVLEETIRVTENGSLRIMNKRHAIIAAMVAKAIKGDVRAAHLVVKLMETHDPALAPETWSNDNIQSMSDEELEMLIRKLGAETETLDQQPTPRP